MTAAAMAMQRVFMVSSLGCDLGAGILARQLYLCNMSAHGRGSEVRSLIVRLLARERGLFAGAAVGAAACAPLRGAFGVGFFGPGPPRRPPFPHSTPPKGLLRPRAVR